MNRYAPGDTLTRSEKARASMDDAYVSLEGMIKALRYLAKEADSINKAHDIPGVEDGLQSIEAAADFLKIGLDYVEAQS